MGANRANVVLKKYPSLGSSQVDMYGVMSIQNDAHNKQNLRKCN